MECYKMIETKGTGHKNDIVILTSFSGKKVEMTREKLKTAIMNNQLCVTNMDVTKNGRLVKVADKVAWLNVDLLSYDVNNGICEVHVQSDNMIQINEFMTGVERAMSGYAGDKGYSYDYKDKNKNGVHDVIVRWIHIDNVVNTLKHISHRFDMTGLTDKRMNAHQNFSYMTDEQFSNLTNYLANNLYCI